jgi:hypothetical protein
MPENHWWFNGRGQLRTFGAPLNPTFSLRLNPFSKER